MNVEKIEKNLDVIDVSIFFIIVFRIVDDCVLKNKNHTIVGLLFCLCYCLIQRC